MKGKGKWIISGSIVILILISISMVYFQNKQEEMREFVEMLKP